jgi:NAD(P)-dependent dehydrogenase (short-subunit alcohol dehydrogenase family)
VAGYYEDKVVIVTGAASGIGAALTRALTQQGTALVVLADVNASGARMIADEIAAGRAGRVEAAPLDVRDAAAFAALVARVVSEQGRVDLLFNNAGIGIGGDVEDLTQEHWDRVIDVNIRGVVNGVRAVYPHMLERGDGHIVNTASMAGLGPAPLLTPYAMTKHAVVGLSTSLRIEAADRGVRVSALCPGGIDTPLLDSSGPADLAQGSFDVRRFLRRVLGKEQPAGDFAREALRGVAKNRGIVIAPARTRAAARVLRHAPRLGTLPMRRAMRAERATPDAQRPDAGGRD